MDNLTHSLVGALMGRMGLKRLTPRAMPALIISANLPDIDGWVAPWFGISSRVAHRGFTHGIGGLVTMPFLAAAIILLWEKLRSGKGTPSLDGEGRGWGDRRRGERALDSPPPSLPHQGGGVNALGLLICCFLGALSHPLLDYLTGYGTRLLEPFSHRWFYGDTLFIVDPWIWIALILGLEYSWRAERLGRNWTRPAITAFGVVLAYIGLNAAISTEAVAATRPLVERIAEPRLVVASEVPLTFWKRHMLWRGDRVAGSGDYDALGGATLDPKVTPLGLNDPRLLDAERRDAQVRDFLFWSRMPQVIDRDGHPFLSDQRFPALRRTIFLVPLDKQ